MAKIHREAPPRLRSNVGARRQTLIMVSCASSSATSADIPLLMPTPLSRGA